MLPKKLFVEDPLAVTLREYYCLTVTKATNVATSAREDRLEGDKGRIWVSSRELNLRGEHLKFIHGMVARKVSPFRD